MTDINHITHIYFLGIGGIGMSALARYFYTRGVSVSGYDKTPSRLTAELQEEGIKVIHDDDPATLDVMPELVIYTPAIPSSNKLFRHFINHHVPMKKRAEVLGMISSGIPTIAVAGTHGKTTISAMLTHILKVAGIPCVSFLGGISTNYNSNYVGEPNPRWMVAEADEFDRSFLQLSPQLALISTIDADHLDVYGSREALAKNFASFAGKIHPRGVLVSKKGIAEELGFTGKGYSYHPTDMADYRLKDVELHQGRYKATIEGELHIEGLEPGHPGMHNLENALGAAALAHQAGVSADKIKEALNSFNGVRRRFEICLQTENIIYVDDYAHHPEEIRACISSARAMWPGRKITGIFQPHLFSRTKELAGEFAESLSALDELILMDIYPAREAPIEGVNAQMILDKVTLQQASYCPREELMDLLENTEPDVLITMGAGDIDRFAGPITQLLKNKALS
ncbi:MAG: UDP-N-acetylmuramate--L-alanine ligase [Bacteroidales bacterium]